MECKRIILETDKKGNPKNLPDLPPESSIEAIFIFPDKIS